MLLLTYLQRTKQISRREFMEMLQWWVISLNDSPVTRHDQTLATGDILQIMTPQWRYEETINRMPVMGSTRLILFHKPKGYVVSKDDPHNRTIYEILPERRKSTYWYVGRLDKESTWLLLLTNNPRLVDYYEQPANNIYKVYEVQIDKPLRTAHALSMKKWMRVTQEGEKTKEPIGYNQEQIELLSCVRVVYHGQHQQHGKHMLTIVLKEWKKRHIRRLLSALWYAVRSLHRTEVGKWKLWDIKLGKRRTQILKGKDIQGI
jgi:pseudouridine synthase